MWLFLLFSAKVEIENSLEKLRIIAIVHSIQSSFTMRLKFLLTILGLSFFLFSCKNKSLINSVWKNCGDNSGLPDILVFNDTHNFVRNDTIYSRPVIDSAIAVINRIETYYGERRLYVKRLSDQKIYRFCEQ